jgi:cell division protein FtsN
VAEMYKDYKKTESLDTGLVGGNGIIWMFSGIVLGLLVGLGMYYVSNYSNDSGSRIDSVQNKIIDAQTTSTKAVPVLYEKRSPKQSPGNYTQFSYYAVLPNLDVPVGAAAKPIETRVDVIEQNAKEAETIASKEVIEQDKNIESRKAGDYLLQVASFKKKSMANLTRGRLAKKGVKAYIQKRKIKGRLWSRVVAGPVDQGNIDNWKLAAEKMGHRPLVIAVR